LLIALCARYNVCMAAKGPIERALTKLQVAIRAAPCSTTWPSRALATDPCSQHNRAGRRGQHSVAPQRG
jgi:hypothetical protein